MVHLGKIASACQFGAMGDAPLPTIDDAPHEPGTIPENAIEMMVATQQAHIQLSQMADQKASILMGTTFVIFTIAVGQSNYQSPAFYPLLVLGGFSFAAAVLAAIAILPAISSKSVGPVNLLFFGSFKRFTEEQYVERILDVLRHDESIYQTMARDIYQNGTVLFKRKYYWLGYAYRVFLIGLTASLLTFLVQVIRHH
jgi:hypothetical protein